MNLTYQGGFVNGRDLRKRSASGAQQANRSLKSLVVTNTC